LWKLTLESESSISPSNRHRTSAVPALLRVSAAVPLTNWLWSVERAPVGGEPGHFPNAPGAVGLAEQLGQRVEPPVRAFQSRVPVDAAQVLVVEPVPDRHEVGVVPGHPVGLGAAHGPLEGSAPQPLGDRYF
jgi:hypothetical protein